MKNFILTMFQDERGSTSSKRVCGVFCVFILCLTLFLSLFIHLNTEPLCDTLVNCVTALAFGCLGLTTIDKFSLKNKQ